MMTTLGLKLTLFDVFFGVEPLIEVQRALGTQWETLVHGMSLLGDSRLILVLAIGMFWYTARHRPYQILAASLLGSALGSGLKLLFDRPRPATEELLIYATHHSPSFPSGHVLLATCFWGTLAWYGWIPRWVAAVIVMLVMFTRVYLGVHFLGDVIFGAVVGIAWLILFHRWLGPRLQQVNLEYLTLLTAGIMAASFVVLPITSAFPFGWEIVGGLVGAGVGLTAKQWGLRFRPLPVSLPLQFVKAIIGVLGIAIIIVVDYLLGPELLALELAMYFFAAVWGLLLAPVIFVLLGIGTTGHQTAATGD